MHDIDMESGAVFLDLWSSLQREAQEIAHQERVLAPIMERMILKPRSLTEALSRRLAADLASADISEKTCQDVLLETLLADRSIIAATAKDLIAVRANDPACLSFAQAFFNYNGLSAVQTHRIANCLWKTGRKVLALWFSQRASMVFGPDIHPAANIGAGLFLDHGAGIVIGETSIVEDDVTIMQNVTLGGTGKVHGDRHPKIRQGVVIGAGAKIIGNIEIGAFSKVGAGSVVLKDVPMGCTVVGVPARVVSAKPKVSAIRIQRPATAGSDSCNPAAASLSVCRTPS